MEGSGNSMSQQRNRKGDEEEKEVNKRAREKRFSEGKRATQG